jgi:hypothetical protein
MKQVLGHVCPQVYSPQVTFVHPPAHVQPQVACPQVACVPGGVQPQLAAMVSGSCGPVTESRPCTVPREEFVPREVSNDSTSSSSTSSVSFFIARSVWWEERDGRDA